MGRDPARTQGLEFIQPGRGALWSLLRIDCLRRRDLRINTMICSDEDTSRYAPLLATCCNPFAPGKKIIPRGIADISSISGA